MQKESPEVISFAITLTIALLLLCALLIIFFLYHRRQQRHVREKEQLRRSFEQELLKARLEIQEQTFRNIAQEIHDNIGQVLSLTKLNLATMDISQPVTLERKIEDSKKLISQAIYDLRNLSHGLSTDHLTHLGLAKSIGHELEMIRKSGEFETAFVVEGNPYILDKQQELIVYRMVQETLNNIIKHASAQKIIIYLRYDPEELTLDITDNGKGFDLTPLNDNASYGLGIKNMYSRAQLMGAVFLISSTLGKGTTVTISVPIVPAMT